MNILDSILQRISNKHDIIIEHKNIIYKPMEELFAILDENTKLYVMSFDIKIKNIEWTPNKKEAKIYTVKDAMHIINHLFKNKIVKQTSFQKP